MADRLEELRRQRALVQQHVDWLDREIAAESAKITQAQTGAKIAAVVKAATPFSSPAIASNTPDPDIILEKYRVPPTALHQDVRKGCFLYLAAALALFFAVVAILYFTLSHR